MALMIKNPPANAGNVRDSGLIPTQEDPLEEGMTTSCLENPMDSGAWWATVRRVEKSWTQLKQLSTHTRIE